MNIEITRHKHDFKNCVALIPWHLQLRETKMIAQCFLNCRAKNSSEYENDERVNATIWAGSLSFKGEMPRNWVMSLVDRGTKLLPHYLLVSISGDPTPTDGCSMWMWIEGVARTSSSFCCSKYFLRKKLKTVKWPSVINDYPAIGHSSISPPVNIWSGEAEG